MSSWKEKRDRLVHYLRKDVWRIELDELSFIKALLIKILRILLIVINGIGKGRLDIRASSLTFYSILSFVPVMAVLYGITNGFGLENNLRQILYDNISLHEEILDQIITFAERIIEKTKGGVMAGVAFTVLIWSVIKVLTTVERTFNNIWQVQKSRDFFRKFSDYLVIILLAPGLMLLGSLVTVFMTTQLTSIGNDFIIFGYISPLLLSLAKIIPYFTIWLLLTLLYMIIPNTKVRLKPALIAGIIAGTLYQLVQWAYIKFQIGVSSYNAIYGSFAALPLFLIWIHLSWTIILLGAEISFANQNVERYDYEGVSLKVSWSYRILLSLLVFHAIIRNFADGNPPLTLNRLNQKLKIPARLLHNILNELVKSGLLIDTYTEEYKERGYQPAKDINSITVYEVIHTLDRLGADDLQVTDSDLHRKFRKILEGFNRELRKHPDNVLLKDL